MGLGALCTLNRYSTLSCTPNSNHILWGKLLSLIGEPWDQESFRFHWWYHINSQFLILEYLGFQISWLNLFNLSVVVCQFERCPCLRRAFAFWLKLLPMQMPGEWVLCRGVCPSQFITLRASLWWKPIGYHQRSDSCLVYCSPRVLHFANQQIIRWAEQVWTAVLFHRIKSYSSPFFSVSP